jgi:stringent starvation protein B
VQDELTSTRPYLLRAMHEWMTDNGQTPLVVVDVNVAGVSVPESGIKDGRIVLNIDWAATRNLVMENDQVSFDARFDGVSQPVSFPLAAVQGIYARESGQGMLFQNEPGSGEGSATAPVADMAGVDQSGEGDDDDNNPPPKGPVLRVVK